jgi:hypothetical protein
MRSANNGAGAFAWSAGETITRSFVDAKRDVLFARAVRQTLRFSDQARRSAHAVRTFLRSKQFGCVAYF